MKREEFITLLSKKLEMTKTDSKIILDAYEELVRELLLSGEDVKISDLGKFVVVDVPERIGTNPITKEAMTIEAHKRIKFKVYDSFRAKVR